MAGCVWLKQPETPGSSLSVCLLPDGPRGLCKFPETSRTFQSPECSRRFQGAGGCRTFQSPGFLEGFRERGGSRSPQPSQVTSAPAGAVFFAQRQKLRLHLLSVIGETLHEGADETGGAAVILHQLDCVSWNTRTRSTPSFHASTPHTNTQP